MKLINLIEQAEHKTFLSKLLDKNLIRLNKLYSQNGHELRIVGGAVRDILSHKVPKDIDLASDATPQESLDILKSNDIRVIETGLQHGTITAHMDGEDYEITTLRIDKNTDGRHADVEFTKDWRQDAERRDLTFNAMSMDFSGNLYDYFGGKTDLESGKAKFVGDTDKRIQEDYLRILRYFRFQGRMDSPTLDPDTLDKIQKNSSGLKQISGERIWAEMSKILSGGNTPDILNSMKKTDVLENIGLANPDLKELFTVRSRTNDPNLLLASLLDDMGDLDTLRNRWKFSTDEYEIMKHIIKYRNSNITLTDAKRLHLNRVKKDLLYKLFEYQGKPDLGEALMRWDTPQFPVNGEDLKRAGVSPGPEMGKLLNTLKTRWIDSKFSMTKDELLNSIK